MTVEFMNRLMMNPAAELPERVSFKDARTPASSRNEDAGRLREAASEFEAMFLSYMLNVMRSTIEESGLGEKGFGRGIYTELFDQELARSLAAKGALGIADILVRKLSEQFPADKLEGANQPDPGGSSGREAIVPPEGKSEDIPDFLVPVRAPVSSGFGMRQDPFTHASRFHRGLDIAAPAGTPVQGAGAGRVTFAGFQGGYGNMVVLQHPDGYETRYAHLEKILVDVGDELPAGHVLGRVGSTGRSTGSHLHFEVRRHGGGVDPKPFLAE